MEKQPGFFFLCKQQIDTLSSNNKEQEKTKIIIRIKP